MVLEVTKAGHQLRPKREARVNPERVVITAANGPPHSSIVKGEQRNGTAAGAPHRHGIIPAE